MNKLKPVVMVFALLALAWGAYAASMTVSSVTLLTANPHETGMYSLTVQVAYSAPSGSTNCKARVSALPSGWIVRDGYNTNYKSLSSCSGTTNFDIMPTTVVSSPVVTVEVGGTASDSTELVAGTGSPSETVVVKSPPSPELTTSVSSSSVTRGGTTTLNYQYRNVGTSETAPTESAILSISSTPSGMVSFAGGATTRAVGSGSISAGQSEVGTATLYISASLSQGTVAYTVTASASNTLQQSSSGGTLTCTDCAATPTPTPISPAPIPQPPLDGGGTMPTPIPSGTPARTPTPAIGPTVSATATPAATVATPAATPGWTATPGITVTPTPVRTPGPTPAFTPIATPTPPGGGLLVWLAAGGTVVAIIAVTLVCIGGFILYKFYQRRKWDR